MAESELGKAEDISASSTVVLEESETQNTALPTVRMKLKKPKPKKKVAWSPDTIDNEHMNKKKSKCCCIYQKPREFGESSSDTDDECDHCKGHVEVKGLNSQPPSAGGQHPLLPLGPAENKEL